MGMRLNILQIGPLREESKESLPICEVFITPTQITFVQFPWYITISVSLRPSSQIFVYLWMYNWQIINRAFEFSVISVKGTIAEMSLVLVLKTNKDLFQVFSKSVKKTDPNKADVQSWKLQWFFITAHKELLTIFYVNHISSNQNVPWGQKSAFTQSGLTFWPWSRLRTRDSKA